MMIIDARKCYFIKRNKLCERENPNSVPRAKLQLTIRTPATSTPKNPSTMMWKIKEESRW